MKEQKFEFSAKNTFFTSDSHWNHSRIIELCKRPFKDVEEMNNSLIENWNKVVPQGWNSISPWGFCIWWKFNLE